MLEAWLVMFSTLETFSRDPQKGNLIAKPSKEHQVDLPFNYDKLKEHHHFGLKWGGEVVLDEEDIDKLKKCSWAAYYCLTEVRTESQLKNNAFIKMHKSIFMS
jgi:hypothetical protein